MMTRPPSSLRRRLYRYRFAIGFLVLATTMTAAGFYLRLAIDQMHSDYDARGREWEEMLALMVGGSTQRQELEVVRDAARRLEQHAVVEANLAENLWYFYKFEEKTKVRLPELHQLSAPTTDGSRLFKRVPYTLRATGSYEQITSFLLALETGPRLVNITSFNCRRLDPEGATLSLNLTIELLGKR